MPAAEKQTTTKTTTQKPRFVRKGSEGKSVKKKTKTKDTELTTTKIKGSSDCGDMIDDAAFDALVGDIQKEVPGIFVPKLGVDVSTVNEWIPMPAPFNEVMGTDGLPCGHIIQALGDSDTGKTTFCNHALVECQRAGGIAVLIDTEHKYDIKRAVQMGLNRDRLLWRKARTIEEVFQNLVSILKIIRARKPDAKIVIVWDSLGGTPCLREVEGYGVDGEDEDEKKQSAEYAPAAAKAIKAGLRKTRYFLQEMNAAFLIINQFYTRTDLKGPMAAYAKKKKAYGGEGPKYFSTIMLEFTRIGNVSIQKDGKKEKIGTKSLVECVKNHIAPPFKTVEVEIDVFGVVTEDRKAGRAPVEA